MLFRSLWWYPYHTYDEWDGSDTAVSEDHWFEHNLLGWMWTNNSFYPWFYHVGDGDLEEGEWLEFLTPDPFLTFFNYDKQVIQAYSYWMELP